MKQLEKLAFRTEQDIPAAKVIGTTFEGTGLTEMDERLDYTRHNNQNEELGARQ